MKSIVIVAYLTSSMAIPAMVIMLYRTVSIVVIKFRISRILIPIVVDLFIIVVVVVMPLMLIVFSCHKVIKTPQQRSKAAVNMCNRCLHCPKLGVGGKLCGLQHTNPLICDLYISINSLRVLLHLTYQSLYNTLRARGLWSTQIQVESVLRLGQQRPTQTQAEVVHGLEQQRPTRAQAEVVLGLEQQMPTRAQVEVVLGLEHKV
jgi:hypothetical protein